MRLSLIFCVLFFTGCSPLVKSDSHLGYLHLNNQRISGAVSSWDAYASRRLIQQFYDHTLMHEYLEARNLLSDGIKGELSQKELYEMFKAVEADYGVEISFTLVPIAEVERMSVLQKGIVNGGFDYYDAIVSTYLSKRREDIFFTFGVTRIDGELRICLFEYKTPEICPVASFDDIPVKGNLTDQAAD